MKRRSRFVSLMCVTSIALAFVSFACQTKAAPAPLPEPAPSPAAVSGDDFRRIRRDGGLQFGEPGDMPG